LVRATVAPKVSSRLPTESSFIRLNADSRAVLLLHAKDHLGRHLRQVCRIQVQDIEYHRNRLGWSNGVQQHNLLFQNTCQLLLYLFKPLSCCCTNFFWTPLRAERIHGRIESDFEAYYDAIPIQICAFRD